MKEIKLTDMQIGYIKETLRDNAQELSDIADDVLEYRIAMEIDKVQRELEKLLGFIEAHIKE